MRGGLLGRIALTYVEWAGGQYEVVPWTLIETRRRSRRFRGPAHGEVRPVHAPHLHFRRASTTPPARWTTNAYRGLRRVIDVSGDGPNNQGRPVLPARADALAKGIVINGLPLMTREGMNASWNIDDLDEYYRSCVIGGPASFVIPVTTWEEFPRAVRQKLVQELVGLPPEGRVVRAQFEELEGSYDCLVGEKMWQRMRRNWRDP